MTQNDFARSRRAAHARLGFTGGAGVQVGEYSALPHGSITPQVDPRRHDPADRRRLQRRRATQSDISRTFVLGKPTDKMKHVFEIERAAQDAALEAAQPGVRVPGGGRRGAQGDRRRRLRARLQVLHPPRRPRHGHGRPRVAVPRARQHAAARAGHDVQRRAGHLHPRRVRRAARRRHGHHRDGRRAVHAAEPLAWNAVRIASVDVQRDEQPWTIPPT